uniref:Peptidylprolyl isomerase n=1 Tax=Leptocylindrus danicus TaxID=163516 RepID=A0A7S2NSN8_9STRA|mmetsp:Transcript_12027/g.18150  ORF Transcript_12027/g.18150 Transcript_12027/m.18150 type:complete len:190 (+) Transcript_12027:101-670(+)
MKFVSGISLFWLVFSLGAAIFVQAFVPSAGSNNLPIVKISQTASRSPNTRRSTLERSDSIITNSRTKLWMGQITQKEAQAGIDKVVKVLQKDRSATTELGNLVKVTNVLGYGSPKAGQIAVRFNAQFRKGGMGRAAIPMPFGLGQTNESEGRGVMVGQVKASIDEKSGKVISCSVFRDLGYGRAFELKC